ncbi:MULTISPECIES: helix-turn-helix domain-containing protein [unclassified Streptomyces]|uniref:helix-turn-helix domain-containing protein n=1 Tax=unclassified Streptomyces TaxID=2593676 RepID=UPI002E2DA884|nr:helix-turn-helix transcriptional regulator [Streptomyces sp. NBC_00223]
MVEAANGSTVPRRQLGRHLRELRNRARLTVRAASTALEWSDQKIWRIETGQTSMRSLDVEAMCRAYGADAEMTQALMGLAKETKGRGWWHAYGDVIPENFDLYIGLEEAAARMSQYTTELVPGLLQTKDYAHTLIREDNPNVGDEEIERRVHVRLARQALLTRVTAPPALEVALNEAVLRRPIGGRAAMSAQLEYLAEMSRLPNVSIRVVPFGVGMHAGIMSGPFTMLRFPVNGDGQPSEPPTVFVDGFTGDLYLDKSNEVERYDAAFQSIWGSALNDEETRDLLHRATKELQP